MIWAFITYVGYLVGAIVSAVAALWLARKGDPARSDRHAGVVALAFSAGWCLASAAFDADSTLVALAEIVANLAWLYVLFRLFTNDGRDESLRIVRPALIALVMVECLQFVLLIVAKRLVFSPAVAEMTFATVASFRLLVAVGAIVLLHNLYVGAAQSSRQLIRWNAAALAGLWAFQLNLYTVAYLTNAVPVELSAMRGVAAAAVSIPFAAGFSRRSLGLQFSPSRAVTFHSLSLAVVGTYLLAMLALAHWIDQVAGDVGRLTQVGLVAGAGALMLVWLPSQKMRGWLRVTAVKHLFKHRYDYRNEWIRFTNTIGRTGQDECLLQERAIKALADITGSSSGLLLAPDDSGAVTLSARWCWSDMDVPAETISPALVAMIEREGLIIDLAEAREGVEYHGELRHIPEWLLSEQRAWALVPLLHFDRLVGIVVLARPVLPHKLDWEDFDLLGVVGRQLASYLAEESGQVALLEASRFDEFNRRMAFVMHDIKNLSSQLSLLIRNAEKHADNPEFRKDMLVTLRNSSDKLNTLLARLGRFATRAGDCSTTIDLVGLAHRVVERMKNQHPVVLARFETTLVYGEREGLEQAVLHLVQNAIDASADDRPVMIEIYSDGVSGRLDVIDNGEGMSAQFLRSGLFKPFVSSKDGGFGIGAYEARELIRSMGGRLDVQSREGLGSRFTIALPLQSTLSILGHQSGDAQNQTEYA